MHPGEFAVLGNHPLEPGTDDFVVLREEPDAKVGDLWQVFHLVQIIARAKVYVDNDDLCREWVEIAEPAAVLLAVHLDNGIATARHAADDRRARPDVGDCKTSFAIGKPDEAGFSALAPASRYGQGLFGCLHRYLRVA